MQAFVQKLAVKTWSRILGQDFVFSNITATILTASRYYWKSRLPVVFGTYFGHDGSQQQWAYLGPRRPSIGPPESATRLQKIRSAMVGFDPFGRGPGLGQHGVTRLLLSQDRKCAGFGGSGK